MNFFEKFAATFGETLGFLGEILIFLGVLFLGVLVYVGPTIWMIFKIKNRWIGLTSAVIYCILSFTVIVTIFNMFLPLD